jgi:hypothetical protein
MLPFARPNPGGHARFQLIPNLFLRISTPLFLERLPPASRGRPLATCALMALLHSPPPLFPSS